MISDSWLKDVGNAVVEDYEKQHGSHGNNINVFIIL